MDDIILVIFCECGFGDQYASLITAYNLLPILKEQGYYPKIFVAKNHKYFSFKTSMSVIFNFDTLESEIEETSYDGIQKYLTNYKLISFTTIQIWVKNSIEDLNNLIYQNIARSTIQNLTTQPKINKNLIQQDILEISKKTTKDREFVALHFRSGDDLMTSNFEQILKHDFWGSQFRSAYNFIEENNEQDVLICSSNLRIVEHLCKKYKNVFSNQFSYPNLDMHNYFGRDFNVDDTIYVEHSKEIFAEMVSLEDAKIICSLNYFASNFVLYGILNNSNYEIWSDKLKYLNS